MTQPLQVDVPGLRSLGGEVVTNGEELGRNVAAVGGRLAPTGGSGTAGWETSAALTGAGQGWRDFLGGPGGGLTGRITQAGQSLVTAADNYHASDQRAAGRNQGRARYE